VTEPTDADGALDADYAAAGFTGRLGWGEKPALVLVDFAVAYAEPTSPLFGGPTIMEAVASAQRLLGVARAQGVPVIFTTVRYHADGRDGGVFFRKVPPLRCFLPDSPLGALIDGFEPGEGETLIVKQYPSAFFATPLASMLRAEGVDTVVITGLTTSGCIRSTATDAMQHGFVPVVVREAVADRMPGPHEANLFDIEAKVGDVVSEAEAANAFETFGVGKGR